MRLKTLLGLILGNLIWSAHPLLGKFVLEDFTPVQGAWLRYTSALIAFVAFRAALPKLRAESFFFPKSKREWLLIAAIGGFAFCFSPLLQLTGLSTSTATDNALIIAMEPLMTIFLAWLILREKLTRSIIMTILIALMGFSLLTGLTLKGLTLSPSHFWGDVILLISLSGEAYYSIGGRKLLEKHSPTAIFGLAIFMGVTALTVAAATLAGETPVSILQAAIHQMTWKSGFAIAYLGPLGTAASYVYWMYALKEAPVASVALTLFVQPVFGSLWGYLFLGERLGFGQTVGGILILIAVFAQTLEALRRRV